MPVVWRRAATWKNQRVLNCFLYRRFWRVGVNAGCRRCQRGYHRMRWISPCKNVELNQSDLSKAEIVRDDVFKLLRACRGIHGEKYPDVIIMDPPKFVENKKPKLMGPAAIKTLTC